MLNKKNHLEMETRWLSSIKLKNYSFVDFTAKL